MAGHESSTACNGLKENSNQRENPSDNPDASSLDSNTKASQVNGICNNGTTLDVNGKVHLEPEKKDSEAGDFRGERNQPERIWSVLLATFIAAMGPLSAGYSLGYSSAAVTELDVRTAPANSTELYLSFQEITWFGVRLKTIDCNGTLENNTKNRCC